MRVKKLIVAAALVAVGLSGAVVSGEPDAHGGHKSHEAKKAQTKCPVMGGDIDPNIYTEYRGRRVYFCCRQCVGEFAKNPGRFASKL